MLLISNYYAFGILRPDRSWQSENYSLGLTVRRWIMKSAVGAICMIAGSGFETRGWEGS